MLLDRKHVSWCLATSVAFGAATGAYVVYPEISTRPYSGGSLVGLIFGVASAAAMIFAGLLAVRKALPLLPVGSAQFWLRGHIWIGLLSVPLALYHASFRWGGPFELVLMSCMTIVVLSGVFGLVVQQIVPRLLKIRVPLETFDEQVPYLCRRFRAEADILVGESCGRFDDDVDYEGIRGEAFLYLQAEGRFRNGKEQEDFAKIMAGVYPRFEGRESTSEAPTRSRSGASLGENATATEGNERLGAIAAGNKVPAEGHAAQGESRPASTKATVSEKRESPLDKLAMAKAAGAAKAGSVKSPSSSDKISSASPGGRATSGSIQDKLAQARAAGAATANEAIAPSSPGAKSKAPHAAAAKNSNVADKLARAKAAGAAKKPLASGPPDADRPATVSAEENESDAPGAVKDQTPAKQGPQALLDKLAKKGVPAKPPKPARRPTSAPDAPLPRREELKHFYLSQVRAFFTDDIRAARAHPFAYETTARLRFAREASELPPPLLKINSRIEHMCNERRQFLEQQRLRTWLHYWQIIHVPVSAMLFVLLAAHVVMALRVVPWEF